jgi:dTMP kinase
MPKGHKGYLISFEGPEGAGKTTLVDKIARWLYVEHGIWPVRLREPGGTQVGEVIGGLLRDPSLKMDDLTELFLFQAARSQIVSERIIPALKLNGIVILDRFKDSSVAYQSIARGLEEEMVRNLNSISTRGIDPDITILLDLPVETGLERKRSAGVLQRIDLEEISFHRKVRKAYLSMSKEDKRWIVIDASRTEAEVLNDAVNIVEGKLVTAGFIEYDKFSKERQA